jgi:hypothetical protein
MGIRLEDFGGFWICKFGVIMTMLNYRNVYLTRNEVREWVNKVNESI